MTKPHGGESWLDHTYPRRHEGDWGRAPQLPPCTAPQPKPMLPHGVRPPPAPGPTDEERAVDEAERIIREHQHLQDA